jgi:hypothetical protein
LSYVISKSAMTGMASLRFVNGYATGEHFADPAVNRAPRVFLGKSSVFTPRVSGR